MSVLSVLSQINKIIERFYSDDSDDTEEDFNEHYNKLRRRFLECYEVINTSLKVNNLHEYEKKNITQKSNTIEKNSYIKKHNKRYFELL